MKKKRKPEIQATLPEKIDARINAIRNRRRGCDRDKETLKNGRIMLVFVGIMLAIFSVIIVTTLYRGVVGGNLPPIWDWLPMLVGLTVLVGLIVFVKKVSLISPEGQITQGNAISKNFRLARASRGSFLQYSIGEKLSKLWEHGNAVAIVACTIVFSSVGLGFFGAGCFAIANHQNLWGLLIAIGMIIFGLHFLAVVGTLRYQWRELDIGSIIQRRSLPKTVVETERMPILIGEENRFFIRQYCKNTDEFCGCSAKISLVLEEKAEYYGRSGDPELTETRQRAKRLVHEHWFDHETESRRYDFSFTAVLPVEDYAPTTHARFLSAMLTYEWYLRVEILSKSGTLLSRDFPVVLSCATEGA